MLLASLLLPAPSPGEGSLVLETRHLRYTISPEGRNLSFVDVHSGRNLLGPEGSMCATLRRNARDLPVTSAVLEGARLTLLFSDPEDPPDAPPPSVVLRVASHPTHLRLTVETCADVGVGSLVFLDVPLTLSGLPTEGVGACALALNLRTHVEALPALQTRLQASAERRFGIVGASVAIVAAPMDVFRAALQDSLVRSSELPLCAVAGPWAEDTAFSHGSYLFNFGSLEETNVEEWIGMTRSLGFSQIDHHGGGDFFRFGDFELNRQRWPEGWESWRRIADRLHAAGIGSIFHTYAFFIDKRSRYVTPVPDPRLDAFRTFTLGRDITAEDAQFEVRESTAGLSTVTGFFEHNSVLLHVGDELMTFSGFSTNPPWRVTGLQRGALGTRPAAHGAGSPARHLKECFGLLVPNPESTLFEEVAAHHAEIVNQCGFDGIYLDAIDGSSILRGPDSCWYWASKFVVEIQKRLRRPVGMEMSAMWHPFWQYRTRWQAWDYPQRGHLAFVDRHAAAVNGGMLLPLHLGWWNFQSWDPPQVEPVFPEVMDTLAARLVGWNAGISLTGAVDRKRLQSVPLFRRAAETLRVAAQLRDAATVDTATRLRLREPGQSFTLVTNAAGQPVFQPIEVLSHLAAQAEPWTREWTITNRHATQPLRFRLEALMTAPSPLEAGTNALVLADLADLRPDSEENPARWSRATARGVSFAATTTDALVPGGHATRLVATNRGQVPRNAAWLRLRRAFTPSRNLKAHQALGLWVEGDGSGALLALRLESPAHLAFGAIADRYLALDFTGPRWITLIESESTRWGDYVWDDGKGLYNVHRETIRFEAVESVTVWLQNLAPGLETRVGLGPVLALPMVPAPLRQPVLLLNDERVVLPVDLMPGQWLEYRGGPDVEVLDARGSRLGLFPLAQNPGMWGSGIHRLGLRAPAQTEGAPRARLTIFAHGSTPDR